jgi:hypothetical protein
LVSKSLTRRDWQQIEKFPTPRSAAISASVTFHWNASSRPHQRAAAKHRRDFAGDKRDIAAGPGRANSKKHNQ